MSELRDIPETEMDVVIFGVSLDSVSDENKKSSRDKQASTEAGQISACLWMPIKGRPTSTADSRQSQKAVLNFPLATPVRRF